MNKLNPLLLAAIAIVGLGFLVLFRLLWGRETSPNQGDARTDTDRDIPTSLLDFESRRVDTTN